MTDLHLYLAQWLTLVVVFSLAVIAPGPDFVVAVRNSIVHSRRAGIITAFGFGLAILIHVSYTVAGIATVIAQSVMLFNIIRYLGAAYLIYLGVQALRSQGMGKAALDHAVKAEKTTRTMTDKAALVSGFLTNVLNPKATLFFLAIFSQIINEGTPVVWMVLYGLTCSVIITMWFSFVAIALTHSRVRNRFLRATKWIDRGCGALMIGLGIKVALTTK